MQIDVRLTSRHAAAFPRFLGNTRRPVRADTARTERKMEENVMKDVETGV